MREDGEEEVGDFSEYASKRSATAAVLLMVESISMWHVGE